MGGEATEVHDAHRQHPARVRVLRALVDLAHQPSARPVLGGVVALREGRRPQRVRRGARPRRRAHGRACRRRGGAGRRRRLPAAASSRERSTLRHERLRRGHRRRDHAVARPPRSCGRLGCEVDRRRRLLERHGADVPARSGARDRPDRGGAARLGHGARRGHAARRTRPHRRADARAALARAGRRYAARVGAQRDDDLLVRRPRRSRPHATRVPRRGRAAGRAAQSHVGRAGRPAALAAARAAALRRPTTSTAASQRAPLRDRSVSGPPRAASCPRSARWSGACWPGRGTIRAWNEPAVAARLLRRQGRHRVARAATWA